jgi:hypothetical protein
MAKHPGKLLFDNQHKQHFVLCLYRNAERSLKGAGHQV